MIDSSANEFIQKAAELTINATLVIAEAGNRARLVSYIVNRLGLIGDVYWSSDKSVEHRPGDGPVFALTIKDRAEWTWLSIRALRKGFNGQICGWAYELNLTNEAAIAQFKFAIEAAFPQITW